MSTAASLPLAGVRVIEFSHMVMGPCCGLLLADLGADVIKVEPTGKDGRGDPTRHLTSTGAGFFAAFNRNKRSVMLDLDSATGRTTARALVAKSDVLIENFRPGALAAQGLGYDDLAAVHPRLIYCSLKGFLPGPYEQRTALDEVVQMMSGLAYMTGPPGRPLRAGAPVNDMMGGLFGALAIVAALRRRETTGRGEYLQSGLFENAAWLMSTHMMQHAMLGTPPVPMSEGKRAWGVYDVFESADGVQIFVGVVTERQWQLFTAALATPALRAPEFASNNDRVRAREQLIPQVAALLKKRPVAEIETLCAQAGLPYARIGRPTDLFDDPQLRAGGLLPLSLLNGVDTTLPALPIAFDGARLPLRRGLPRAGEHTDEVLREFGLSPDAPPTST